MFDITNITVDGGTRSSVFFGGQPGKEVVGPTNALGPANSVYVLALPGLGYIKFTDVGNSGNFPQCCWRIEELI